MLLARREIARAKLRFGLLTVAVGLLVFLIVFQQVLLGSLLQSFTGALANQSATVLVYGKDSRKNLAGSVVLPPQVEAVRAVEGVARAAQFGEATLTFEAGGEQRDVSVFGFEPDGPGQPTRVVEGRLPRAAGETVASKEDTASGFAIGDTITSSAGGVPLTIVGLTEQSRFSVSPTVWVHWDDYVGLRKAANPNARGVVASAVAVEPVAGVSPGQLVARISSAVPDVLPLTRDQAVSEAPGVASVSQSFVTVQLLFVIVVTLVVGFFFVILTVQKMPSLTLLRAIGAPTRYLVGALLRQMFVVVGGGIAIGVGLLLAVASAARAGLPLDLRPGPIVALCLTVLVFSVLGGLVAIRRVLRIDPFSVVGRQSLGGLA